LQFLVKTKFQMQTMDDLDKLNQRFVANFEQSMNSSITLTPTRSKAFEINTERLNSISSPAVTFIGYLEGQFREDDLPAERELTLKVGAQVMFVKNDSEKRWVNGTLGKVVKVSKKLIRVQITSNGGRIFDVPRATWESYKHKYDPLTKKIKIEVIGRYTQYPLKMAWAITINKSQGLTFDDVAIDLDSGAFACGQTYVALSRCRSLQGIVLKEPVKYSDIKVDPTVVEFMQKMKETNFYTFSN